jgi:hypothetical protein
VVRVLLGLLGVSILELLEQNQREIDGLFQAVDRAVLANKPRFARALFHKLSIKILGSIHAKKAIVYPRLVFDARLGAEVAEATRADAAIEAAIDRLRIDAMPLDAWRHEIRKLRGRLADHAMSERWVLFPIATLALTDAQMHTIADEFRAYEPVAASVAGPTITYTAA